MGVSHRTYINWETGERYPVISMFPRIIEFLGYDPVPVPDDLPGRIKAVRRRLGLFQDQFASTYGFDASCVSRWEHRRSVPSPRSRKRLEGVFAIVL